MSTDTDSLVERFSALRQSYSSDLPAKVAELDTSWKAALADPSDLACLRNLISQCHNLAGSGATFGYPEVSRLTRQIEKLLTDTLDHDAPLDDGMQRVVDGYLADLRETIHRQHGGRPPEPDIAADVDDTEPAVVWLIADADSLDEAVSAQLELHEFQVITLSYDDALIMEHCQDAPAAVIVDLDSASVDAAELMACLTAATHEEVVAIMLSSDASLDRRLSAVRCGAHAFFVRPIDTTALVEMVDKIAHPPESDPYRVLVVEDDRAMAAFASLTLEQSGMRTQVVMDPQELMQAIEDLGPELILMDVYMPGCTGMELASVIRQQPNYVGTPIVYLSGETDIRKQLTAMRCGADDFLTKPIRPTHLISTVTTRVERFREIRSFMLNDSLTGLLNHTYTKECLDVEISRAQRTSSPLSFVMIDIDHFKRVNDTYGHPIGDRVIKSLSSLLKRRLRKTDTVGRYGGEEFAVILPGANLKDAARVMDQIRQSFAEMTFHHDGVDFHVTISSGVAALPDFQAAADLKNAADRALYQAKAAGRDRVCTRQPDDG